MNTKQLRRRHRAVNWVPPSKDEKGNVTKLGYHRVSFRAWVRAQAPEQIKPTGKAATFFTKKV